MMSSGSKRVSSKNGSADIAGVLHLPDGFNEARTYAALVIVTPDSSVKDQIGAVWGSVHRTGTDIH